MSNSSFPIKCCGVFWFSVRYTSVLVANMLYAIGCDPYFSRPAHSHHPHPDPGARYSTFQPGFPMSCRRRGGGSWEIYTLFRLESKILTTQNDPPTFLPMSISAYHQWQCGLLGLWFGARQIAMVVYSSCWWWSRSIRSSCCFPKWFLSDTVRPNS